MEDQVRLLRKLEELAKKGSGNKVCAECPERHPNWVCLIRSALKGGETIAAFVCHSCSKHHFQMGIRICEVKSLTLATEWSESEVAIVTKSGNKVVNSIYEGKLDQYCDEKEIITFDKDEAAKLRAEYIFNKYIKRKYFSEEKFHARMTKFNPAYMNLKDQPKKDASPPSTLRAGRKASRSIATNSKQTQKEATTKKPTKASTLQRNLKEKDPQPPPPSTVSSGTPISEAENGPNLQVAHKNANSMQDLEDNNVEPSQALHHSQLAPIHCSSKRTSHFASNSMTSGTLPDGADSLHAGKGSRIMQEANSGHTMLDLRKALMLQANEGSSRRGLMSKSISERHLTTSHLRNGRMLPRSDSNRSIDRPTIPQANQTMSRRGLMAKSSSERHLPLGRSRNERTLSRGDSSSSFDRPSMPQANAPGSRRRHLAKSMSEQDFVTCPSRNERLLSRCDINELLNQSWRGPANPGLSRRGLLAKSSSERHFTTRSRNERALSRGDSNRSVDQSCLLQSNLRLSRRNLMANSSSERELNTSHSSFHMDEPSRAQAHPPVPRRGLVSKCKSERHLAGTGPSMSGGMLSRSNSNRNLNQNSCVQDNRSGPRRGVMGKSTSERHLINSGPTRNGRMLSKSNSNRAMDHLSPVQNHQSVSRKSHLGKPSSEGKLKLSESKSKGSVGHLSRSVSEFHKTTEPPFTGSVRGAVGSQANQSLARRKTSLEGQLCKMPGSSSKGSVGLSTKSVGDYRKTTERSAKGKGRSVDESEANQKVPRRSQAEESLLQGQLSKLSGSDKKTPPSRSSKSVGDNRKIEHPVRRSGKREEGSEVNQSLPQQSMKENSLLEGKLSKIPGSDPKALVSRSSKSDSVGEFRKTTERSAKGSGRSVDGSHANQKSSHRSPAEESLIDGQLLGKLSGSNPKALAGHSSKSVGDHRKTTENSGRGSGRIVDGSKVTVNLPEQSMQEKSLLEGKLSKLPGSDTKASVSRSSKSVGDYQKTTERSVRGSGRSVDGSQVNQSLPRQGEKGNSLLDGKLSKLSGSNHKASVSRSSKSVGDHRKTTESSVRGSGRIVDGSKVNENLPEQSMQEIFLLEGKLSKLPANDTQSSVSRSSKSVGDYRTTTERSVRGSGRSVDGSQVNHILPRQGEKGNSLLDGKLSKLPGSDHKASVSRSSKSVGDYRKTTESSVRGSERSVDRSLREGSQRSIQKRRSTVDDIAARILQDSSDERDRKIRSTSCDRPDDCKKSSGNLKRCSKSSGNSVELKPKSRRDNKETDPGRTLTHLPSARKHHPGLNSANTETKRTRRLKRLSSKEQTDSANGDKNHKVDEGAISKSNSAGSLGLLVVSAKGSDKQKDSKSHKSLRGSSKSYGHESFRAMQDLISDTANKERLIVSPIQKRVADLRHAGQQSIVSLWMSPAKAPSTVAVAKAAAARKDAGRKSSRLSEEKKQSHAQSNEDPSTDDDSSSDEETDTKKKPAPRMKSYDDAIVAQWLAT